MRRRRAGQSSRRRVHRPSQAQTRLRSPGPALLADAAGGNRRGRTTARSREARALGGDQRQFDRTDRGAARVAQIRFAGRTRADGGAAGTAGRPRSGFCSALLARIRKSTFTIRPAAPTMPNLTIGAGSVSSVCQSLWCPSSAKSTRPLRPLSRRSRVPQDRERRLLFLLARSNRGDRRRHRLVHLLAQTVIREIDVAALRDPP